MSRLSVIKALIRHKKLKNYLEIGVFNFGLGIVVPKPNEQPLSFSREEICNLSYEDLDVNRAAYLGLQPPSYFFEYFGIKP
jgi:hypothetical protein